MPIKEFNPLKETRSESVSEVAQSLGVMLSEVNRTALTDAKNMADQETFRARQEVIAELGQIVEDMNRSDQIRQQGLEKMQTSRFAIEASMEMQKAQMTEKQKAAQADAAVTAAARQALDERRMELINTWKLDALKNLAATPGLPMLVLKGTLFLARWGGKLAAAKSKSLWERVNGHGSTKKSSLLTKAALICGAGLTMAVVVCMLPLVPLLMLAAACATGCLVFNSVERTEIGMIVKLPGAKKDKEADPIPQKINGIDPGGQEMIQAGILGDVEAIDDILKNRLQLIYAVDADKMNVLHWAANEGQGEVIDKIVEHKGSRPLFSALDKDGLSPLMRAVKEKQLFAAMALGKGMSVADFDVKNADGLTARDMAEKSGQEDIVRIIDAAMEEKKKAIESTQSQERVIDKAIELELTRLADLGLPVTLVQKMRVEGQIRKQFASSAKFSSGIKEAKALAEIAGIPVVKPRPPTP